MQHVVMAACYNNPFRLVKRGFSAWLYLLREMGLLGQVSCLLRFRIAMLCHLLSRLQGFAWNAKNVPSENRKR